MNIIQEKMQPMEDKILPAFFTPGEDTKHLSLNNFGDLHVHEKDKEGLENPAFSDGP